MIRTSPLVFLATIFLGTAATLATENAVWPQWRGPTRNGFVESGSFPSSLKSLTQIWRVDLGTGYSSPIVSSDRVFTVETTDGKEIARGLDRASGKQLWQATWEGSIRVPFFAMRNGSWVRATPAYDGHSLYVAGIRDVLVSLNAETGSEQWRVDFVERYKSTVPTFGFVSSPLVVGDALYVQAAGSFLKLDKNSGKTIWRILEDGGGDNGAFSSPVLATIAGRPQLLVQTRNQLVGVNPQDGTVLWKKDVPAFRGMNILNPVPFENGVLTSSYGGKTLFFNVQQGADKSFHADNAWQLNIQGYMSTPVVIDGYAYLLRVDHRLTCINLRDGKEAWTDKPGFGDYASFVTDGKEILALDAGGELLLIRANAEKFELLDRRRLTDAETWAHVAVCGDEVFVRELKGMAVYRWAENTIQKQSATKP